MSIFSYMIHGEILSAIVLIVARAFVVFFMLPFHEFSHGFIANKLGDPTAKNAGRLTLNPLAHLDPFGTILLFVFGFGWAKPVPVNIGNFKKPKEGMALTALAGPVSNLLLAFVSLWLYNLAVLLQYKVAAAGMVFHIIGMFFQFAASTNIMLAVFNLIPVPPLDGSRILNALLPYKTYYKLMQYERYFSIAIMILVVSNLLNRPIMWLSDLVMKALNFLPNLFLRLFL